MDEIEIKFKDKSRLFYAEPHFYDRLNERTSRIKSSIELPEVLLKAVYIKSRPNNVATIIKHGLCAFYLFDDVNKLVYVIEENGKTRIMNILKTVYTSSESDWVLIWLSKNPKATRKRFSEVFHDDKIFR